MSAQGTSERLRVAMAANGVEVESLARSVGVDPKTVQRWLKGRLPHPRHRWKASDALGCSEQDLWPEIAIANASGTAATAEIMSAYARRADTPVQLWSRMLDRATTSIDLLGYAMLFFPEQHPDLPELLTDKCARGLQVRILLADPYCPEAAIRDDLEGLDGTLSGRIRSTVRHFEPLLDNPGVELRYHRLPLYNAVYRFDDQMLVTPYLYRLHGFQHPLLHLKRLGPAGIFESYAHQFEAIWTAPTTTQSPTADREQEI
nr:helix-turn-helix transcriptional regulator [Parafrankia sp. Ea1.12]